MVGENMTDYGVVEGVMNESLGNLLAVERDAYMMRQGLGDGRSLPYGAIAFIMKTSTDLVQKFERSALLKLDNI